MGFWKKDAKTGIIEASFMNTNKNEYRAPMNLRDFYEGLNEFFLYNNTLPFKDNLGEGKDRKIGNFFEHGNKEGELVEPDRNLNRTKNMYEKKFTWAKNDGSVEFEMEWEAHAVVGNSPYGWFEIRVNLVNRALRDVEVQRGNKKIKLQDGAWEFRLKMVYKNRILKDFFRKIPLIGKNPTFEDMYLERIYLKQLERDLLWCMTKIKAPLLAYIDSHLGPPSN